MANPRTTVILFAFAGVMIITTGFLFASIFSCTESRIGYGPAVYQCPDGTYVGSANPHPYFDLLAPWLLGGILTLFTAAYRYQKSKLRQGRQ